MNYSIPDFDVDYEINKIDPYPRLSESMKKVLKFQAENSKDAFDTNCGWDELRIKYNKERLFWNEGGPVAHKIEELSIDGPAGSIGLRIYYPNDAPLNHACIFLHGGGYTVGNPDTHDRIMRFIMKNAGCIVVGVDYKLAPEYKFPTQLFECVEVINFFHNNGEEYGINPNSLSIAGDSGGGNLALSTNLYLRDVCKDNTYIKALLLYYPSLGLYDGESMRLYGWDLDGMKYNDLKYYDSCYIDEEYIENPYYKLVNADLKDGIPATYLACGDIDPLLDNSKILFEIMKSNEKEVELEIIPGVLHAFLHYSRMMPEAEQVLINSSEFLKNVISK